MTASQKREVWLRGPLPEITALLQPVAHALLQASEELDLYLQDFPEDLLWEKPAGVASVGFHLQHLTGVLDRLFTYARGESLSTEQQQWLTQEGIPVSGENLATHLVQSFHRQVEKALQQLKETPAEILIEVRQVGRAQIPSTVMGLLVHAAEHTTRHLGQLLVTSKILKKGFQKS
ncbi:MAG: DinB family protein [Rufibacter sp.]